MLENDGKNNDPDLAFDRALSPGFRALIDGCGPLRRFLQAPGQLKVSHRLPVTYGAQFRRRDVVSVCVGLTKVLDLRLLDSGELEASAHTTYQTQECARRLGVFGRFNPCELETRVPAWADYLGQVKVGKEHWQREGAWQGWLAHRAFLGVPQPWTLLDREAEQLEGLVGEHLRALRSVRSAIAAKCLEQPLFQRRKGPILKSRGGGIDFLGITPEGNVALIEVKHATDAVGSYCTPIQVGGYAALWERALSGGNAREKVVKPMQRLLDQKRDMGFLPGTGPVLAATPTVEPSVVIAEPNFNSRVWHRNGLLAGVLAASRAAGVESASRTRFFVCDARDFVLREVTRDLQSGREVTAA